MKIGGFEQQNDSNSFLDEWERWNSEVREKKKVRENVKFFNLKITCEIIKLWSILYAKLFQQKTSNIRN